MLHVPNMNLERGLQCEKNDARMGNTRMTSSNTPCTISRHFGSNQIRRLFNGAEVNPNLMKQDSLGLAIFADEDFKISDRLDTFPAELKDSVAERLMRICDDIGASPRMMGSGKYLPNQSNKIVAGPSTNDAQGLLLGADSLYYILVCAPMFKTFEARLTVKKNNGICSNEVEHSGDNIYNFNSNNVVSYCPPAGLGGPSTKEANIQDNLPHLKMESQWTDFCWYKISAPDPRTEVAQFTVKSQFEGKLAIYTYGDINDFTTYTLVKHQLFGFSSQDTIVHFSIPHVPQQEMLMLIGHNKGQSGKININMTEVRPVISQ
jgi:hypothetical protein